MRAKIITMLTDFGLRDAYVGMMKGVVLGINPDVSIVDISHDLAPQDVFDAAFVLGNSYTYFPEGTIHLAVVDPGVGSSRKGIAIEAGGYIFVGPDNGLFSLVLKKEEVWNAVELIEKKFFLSHISQTFHGRDIFAPVAAHLSLGVKISELGNELKSVQQLSFKHLIFETGKVSGEIIHVDGFGNLVTNFHHDDLKELIHDKNIGIAVGNNIIFGVSRSYAEKQDGELLTVFGSSGFLEISVSMGNAAEVLNMRRGDKVEVLIR